MGLIESAKALISLKMDTSQARTEAKAFRGVEQQAARDRLAELEKVNKGIDAQLLMYAKLASAIGLGVAAFKMAQGAAKSYLEDVRLQSAAAGVNLDKLKAATSGLVEADTLLAFAGKSMHGVWKLNQAEMERVLQGAMALRKTMGVELQPTVEALTESITKGSTRALKELGIEAKDKEGVLQALDAQVARLGGNFALAGDDIERSEKAMADSVDDLKGSFGELVVALGPVISAMSKVVDLVTKSVEGWKMLFRGGDEYTLGSMGFDARKDAMIDELQARYAAEQADADKRIKEVLAKRATAPFDKTAADTIKANERAGKAGGRTGRGDSMPALENYGLEGISSTAAPQGGAIIERSDADQFASFMEDWNEKEKTRRAEVMSDMERMRDMEFASIFGSTAELDEHAMAIEALASSFDVLSNAAGSAYDAMISGSGDMADAFKKALAGGIAALGKDMFIKGLAEAAHAIAAAASYNWDAAGKHAAAAAAYGAGAIAAGVAANALGYGGGGGSTPSRPSVGGGRAGNSLGPRAGRGDVERNVTVILGGGYDNMSERERNARFARAVKRGMSTRESTTIRDG